MNPNKALWEKGDFTRIATTMRESGEALVQRLGIKKGMKVLDLGCGDGTTALPAAKLGADVLGVDIASNLVAAGNQRAREHGLSIPNDPTLVAQILKISSAYTPPPPEGFVSPMTWGVESHVVERFAGAGVPKEKINFTRDTFTFNSARPPAAVVDDFRRYYGPTMNAFDAAEKNGRADELRKELETLFNSQNKSPNKDATSIPATFLRVTVEV
jgi:SAM-dependent methyltransferase